MAITPQTKVHLLKGVPLYINKKHQLYFENRTQQFNYFSSKIFESSTDFQYQRKDSVIMYPKHIDSILECNYVMYQNSNYSDKWFYAFVESMEYESEGCTRIKIKTDVFQTWFHDITFLPSFVKREHIEVDDLYANLLSESIETGEYIKANQTKINELDNLYIIVSQTFEEKTNLKINDDTKFIQYLDAFGKVYQGVYSGCVYYGYELQDYNKVSKALKSYAKSGKLESVNSIFMIPKFLTNNSKETDNGCVLLEESMTSPRRLYKYKRKFALGNYIPKNRKLLTYPFCFLHVTTNNGQSADYPYEYFNTRTGDVLGDCIFGYTGNVSENCKVILFPMDYKNLYENFEEILTLSDFPVCSFPGDVYSNWVSKNAVPLMTSATMDVIASANGVKEKEIDTTMRGVFGVLNTLNTVENKRKNPVQTMGQRGNGNVNTGYKIQNFYFTNMHIREDYAKRIDSYFDMYGYATNTIKIPNLNSRPHWNYIETGDLNIKGNVPQSDLQEFKELFDNGITLWKSANEVGNYSLNNHDSTSNPEIIYQETSIENDVIHYTPVADSDIISPNDYWNVDEFTPRLSAPSSDESTYQLFNSSTYNPYCPDYAMPNCTCYAFGRRYEIEKTRPNLSPNDAYKWWEYNITNHAYMHGQTAQLGAVAVWGNGTTPANSTVGHVAVVEEIYENGDYLISESAWMGFYFNTRRIVNNAYGNYHFFGFIYLDRWEEVNE